MAAKNNAQFYNFNAGVVSRLALARTDLAALRMAAEEQTNLFPRVLGPATFRPGTRYIASTKSDATARILPFVFNSDTKAVLELTGNVLRVLVDDVIVTRPAVTAQTTNGSFTTNLSGWTDADEGSAVSDWQTGGYMGLTGTGSAEAIRQQTVTVTETGTEHALRVVVARGPITFKVGASAGADGYIAETSLGTGEHSLAFTPTGNFHITVSSAAPVLRLVDSIIVEAAGAVEIPTPWASGDLAYIRHAQSGDVLFCACDGIKQQRIERRSQRSWSVVDYAPEDGPFAPPNTMPNTITASAVKGNITLTASARTFKSGHVGALWKLSHTGQTATAVLSGPDQFTDPIRVSGVGNARLWSYDITGTFTGTIRFQRSFGEPGAWTDYSSVTAPASNSAFQDNQDNQIIYYRVGFKSGEYTSGSATATLASSSGLQDGIVRITGYTSSTSVSAEVLRTLGKATATSSWAGGEWSTATGFPGSVAFHDGRLWWGWLDYLYGSVSDAYSSFDQELEGDAAAIIRSVATGGFEGIYWLLSLQRLLAGTGSQEVSIRSSSFDEPLTPKAFTARAASSRGSANIQAAQIDSHGIFVQRNLKDVYALAFSGEAQDYGPQYLTRLVPEICAAGVNEVAVQRQPDTRVWCVLNDGTCGVLIYEPNDDVVAWIKVTTAAGGLFRSVTVLPGSDEDDVHFVVQRTVNGVTRRYHERLTYFSGSLGGTLSRNIDCHTEVSQAASTSITGLSHLIGEQVVVWANGKPLVTDDAPKTVSAGGAITGLSESVTSAIVGLAYTGKFKSAKLPYGAGGGTGVSQRKRMIDVSLLMADAGVRGIQVGRTFTEMTGLPLKNPSNGQPLSAGTHVLPAYDYDMFPMSGDWGTDERLCFQVTSPYPATFLGAVLGMQTNTHELADATPKG